MNRILRLYAGQALVVTVEVDEFAFLMCISAQIPIEASCTSGTAVLWLTVVIFNTAKTEVCICTGNSTHRVRMRAATTASLFLCKFSLSKF